MDGDEIIATEIPATNAAELAEAIRDTYGENNPIAEQLINAINEGQTREALGLAHDLFSGTDNPVRLFHLTNHIRIGGGSIAGHAVGGAYSHENSQSQRSADAVTRYLLASQSASFGRTMQNIAIQQARAERMLRESRYLRSEIDRLRDAGLMDPITAENFERRFLELEGEISEMKTRLNEARIERQEGEIQRNEALSRLPENVRNVLGDLVEKGSTIITAQYSLPGDNLDPPRRYIVFKDDSIADDSRSYYILRDQNGPDIPENRVPIDPDTDMGRRALEQINRQDRKPEERFGNQLTPAERDSYNTSYTTYLDYCTTYGLQDQREDIVRAFAMVERADARLEEYTRRLDELERQYNALREEMINEMDRVDPQGAEARRRELQRIQDEYQDVVRDFERNQSRYNENTQTLTRAIQSVIELEAAKAAIERISTRFDDRHEQLRAAYSDPTARAHAWENPLQTNVGGVMKDVYRDNETGELYWYDATTHQRHEIEDPREMARLYTAAYEAQPPGLFKNETPSSEDPNNTFSNTLNARLSTQDMADHLEREIDEARVAVSEIQTETSENAPVTDTAVFSAARMDGPRITGPFAAVAHTADSGPARQPLPAPTIA